MEFDAKLNADRFKGFADVYDQARPSVPAFVPEIIARYLNRRPDTVVDLGCGTGLSSLVWEGRCRRAIGIEPSGDMLREAVKKTTDTLSFIRAFAGDTTLERETADAVVCSQSFHWMEPAETLREIDRILKPGGVFATVDCDWPPVCGWEAELAYDSLTRTAEELLKKTGGDRLAHKWEKEKHLENIRQSGYFRYCREIVFCHREEGSAERLIRLAESQGGIQTLLKNNPEAIEPRLAEFREKIRRLLEGRFPMEFCYRMRIGVK